MGLSAADLERLSVVHVAGTKGKVALVRLFVVPGGVAVCVRVRIATPLLPLVSSPRYTPQTLKNNQTGSTCAMVEAALRASGYRTALFTSPHLCDVRERVRVDG